MPRTRRNFDKDLKENAMKYFLEYKELGKRGFVNYSSDEPKKNARLQKELRDTKDDLEILKKPSTRSGYSMCDRNTC